MKKLGFGCMRLPLLESGEVDQQQFNAMIDAYMAAGFNYFDTAHVYISGKSELAMRQGLVERYPRESYRFVNKLSPTCYKTEGDIRPFFDLQLEACGVDYFDWYLMHSVSAKWFAHAQACNAFEIVKQLKAEGKVKHIAMSFHDSPEVLEQVLTAWPEVEAVQIQFNYLDYDDPKVQSWGCYQVCRKFNKPVLIMEPVKGGTLATLPPAAQKVLSELGGGSPASYAIRYAASFEGVMMVLSGMSTMEQMEDNLSYMTDFIPLNDREMEALVRVREILRCQESIPCTGCRYCVEGCPMSIPIPELFSAYNAAKRGEVVDMDLSPAKTCIACRACEGACPQHLPIPELLEQI